MNPNRETGRGPQFTSSMYSETSPSVVFSIRPLTTRANSGSSSTSRLTVMMGVEIFLEALMISLILGTPRVMFIDATPAKWNVLSVIYNGEQSTVD